ncbi:MAG TPA: FAD-dependent oxidoreductase [Rhodothermales bacterium]|nr:FAD-dependent oxidoreductase [Rhodothermales bacterium]
MDGSYEHIVIGGGLAGSVSAYYLADRGSTLLLEKNKIGSGASGALSGLVNPFMSRKANPVWRWQEALEAVERLIAETKMTAYFQQSGVLRPAAAFPQKLLFRDVARSFPDDASWLQAHAVNERWPAVSASNGALYVHRGGALEMEPFVRGVARAAEERGCEIKTGCLVRQITPDGETLIVRAETEDFRSRKVILCPGGDFRFWPQLASMQLHPIRGQLVETPIPADLTTEFPCLSGAGYVVRYAKRLILGSTFRHTFEGLTPSADESEEIIRKTATLLPVVRVAPIKRAWVGIRVTVPGTRLPVVGPVDKSGNLWVFTGLGSKGILMSSLIGANLSDYLRDPASIPPEIRAV